MNSKIAAFIGVCALATQASASTQAFTAFNPEQTTDMTTDFTHPRGPTTDYNGEGYAYRGGQMDQSKDTDDHRDGKGMMNGNKGRGEEGKGKDMMHGGKGMMDRGERGQKDRGQDKGKDMMNRGGRGQWGMKNRDHKDDDGMIHRPMNGNKWTDDERDSCYSSDDCEDRRVNRWGDNDDDNEGRKSGRGDRKRSNKKRWNQEDSCEESGNDTDKWTDREDDCDSEHEHGDRHDDDHDNKHGRVGRRHNNKKMNSGMKKHHEKRWGQEEDSCEESGNDTDKWTDKEDYSGESDCDEDKKVDRHHNKKMMNYKRHHEKRSHKKSWGEDSCEESGNDTDKWTDKEDCDSEHGDDKKDYCSEDEDCKSERGDKNGRGSHHLRGRFTEQTCDNDNDCDNNGLTSISKKEVTKTTTKFGLSPAFIVKLKDAQMRAEGAKAALDGILCDLEQAQDEVEKADRRLTKLLKKIVHHE